MIWKEIGGDRENKSKNTLQNNKQLNIPYINMNHQIKYSNKKIFLLGLYLFINVI